MLFVEDGKLVARPATDSNVSVYASSTTLDKPVAFFIPEHMPDPTVLAAGEELWVEITVPKKGPPRPIRLGVRKGGVLKPVDSN